MMLGRRSFSYQMVPFQGTLVKFLAEQFHSPNSFKKSNQKLTKKNSIPLPHQKKPTKMLPLAIFGSENLEKTHLPRPLPWQQLRLVVVEALGLEDQNLRNFGWAPLKGGWWFCRLKKHCNITISRGFPGFFGGLPRLFVF